MEIDMTPTSLHRLSAVVAVVMTSLACVVLGQGREGAIRYHVIEELPADTVIGNVAADGRLSDLYNSSTLQILRYSFLYQPDQASALFSLDPVTGVIRTASRVDRDALCPEAVSCIQEMSVAVSPALYFQVFPIQIDIRDHNDNAPLFPEESVVKVIPESASVGATFTLPVPADPDSPEFGVQDFKIVETGETRGMFDIKSSKALDGSIDLQLILKAELDREAKDSYSVTIMALDGGRPPMSGSVTVQIQVEDANDNHPEFDSESYEVSVPENFPPEGSVAKVTAHDTDLGVNADIRYGFSARTQANHGELFRIDATSGEVFLSGHLDYEDSNLYHLVVTAADGGPERHSAQAMLVIRIEDVNDNPPRITVNTLTASGEAEISETSPIGTFVSHVSVSDPDGGQTTCQVTDGNFRLQKMGQSQYKLVTDTMFDREERDRYEIAVSCSDRGSPALTSTQDLVIRVLDTNDHAPVFSKRTYGARITENNEPGAFIVRVQATDADVGDNARIEYSLAEDTPTDYVISHDTGIIRASRRLDHEKVKNAAFVVRAHDSGEPRMLATATVSVEILDSNDEVPKFTRALYSFGVLENRAAGEEVGYISARDADSAPYNIVQYALQSNDPETLKCFAVDPDTGRITLRKPLDRERMDVYRLQALAFNPGTPRQSDTVELTIYVADVNDHPPVFTFPSGDNRTATVSGSVPIGYVITRIRTHDLDVGDNEKVTFDILAGNEDALFGMDHATGAVTLETRLSGVGDKIFNLTILAQDGGKPPLTSQGLLHIQVDQSLPYIINGVDSGAQGSGNVTSGSKFNSLIVILVGCLSGAIIVALVVAIVAIRYQDNRKQIQNRYNCRQEAQKMLYGRQSPDSGSSMASCPPTPGHSPSAAAQVSFSGLDAVHSSPLESGLVPGSCSRTSSFLEHGSTQSEQYLVPHYTSGKAPRSRQSWPLSAGGDHKEPGSGSATLPPGGDLPGGGATSPRHLVVQHHSFTLAPSSGLGRQREPPPSYQRALHHPGCPQHPGPHRPHSLRRPQLTPLAENEIQMECLTWTPDQDEESVHSGEVSNTDSGRGPSEEGEGHHAVGGANGHIDNDPEKGMMSPPGCHGNDGYKSRVRHHDSNCPLATVRTSARGSGPRLTVLDAPSKPTSTGGVGWAAADRRPPCPPPRQPNPGRFPTRGQIDPCCPGNRPGSDSTDSGYHGNSPNNDCIASELPPQGQGAGLTVVTPPRAAPRVHCPQPLGVGSRPVRHHHPLPGPNHSFVYPESICESLCTTEGGDDASSTTSGSYTVEDEEEGVAQANTPHPMHLFHPVHSVTVQGSDV